METKLTALEWYHTKLAEQTTEAKDVNTIFLLAKGMEKEQIIEAINYGCSDWGSFKDVEQYYKDTYEK